MEMGLLHYYFGNFFHAKKKIIFMWGNMQDEIEPIQGENETNLGKQEKLEKLKISFFVGGDPY